MPLRTHPQSNKRSGLPLGISGTWRIRPDRRPAYEFMVTYREGRAIRTKHFHVGPSMDPELYLRQLQEAIKFRRAYEARYATIHRTAA